MAGEGSSDDPRCCHHNVTPAMQWGARRNTTRTVVRPPGRLQDTPRWRLGTADAITIHGGKGAQPASNKPDTKVSETPRRPTTMQWRTTPASPSGKPFNRPLETRSALGWRLVMPGRPFPTTATLYCRFSVTMPTSPHRGWLASRNIGSHRWSLGIPTANLIV